MTQSGREGFYGKTSCRCRRCSAAEGLVSGKARVIQRYHMGTGAEGSRRDYPDTGNPRSGAPWRPVLPRVSTDCERASRSERSWPSRLRSPRGVVFEKKEEGKPWPLAREWRGGILSSVRFLFDERTRPVGSLKSQRASDLVSIFRRHLC